MRKAKSGEPITVGFLGGSITQGCLSSTPETCYAYLVYEWWKKQFPDTSVTYVNAGIGGTTSQFGVARADRGFILRQEGTNELSVILLSAGTFFFVKLSDICFGKRLVIEL
mgnify:CR=1 FL=1